MSYRELLDQCIWLLSLVDGYRVRDGERLLSPQSEYRLDELRAEVTEERKALEDHSCG